MNMEYQDAILLSIKDRDELNSLELQKELGITYEALYAELVSLVADNYLQLEANKIKKVVLTQEGEQYAAEGTPEARIFALASLEGTPK